MLPHTQQIHKQTELHFGMWDDLSGLDGHKYKISGLLAQPFNDFK